ncbi:hypothetical protein U0070_021834, partial [Myodes glareolus]
DTGFFVSEEIIGGVESKPHSRPYMAYLKILTDNNSSFICGGFLICEEFVMTAAHCKGREIIVTLGAHDVSKTEFTQQKIKVEKQIVYPHFNFNTKLHDIMLLKLQRKAQLNPDVATIPLPSPSDFVKHGNLCWASGWGQTGVKGPFSVKLREVKLQITGTDGCKYYSNYNNDFQVCGGTPGFMRTTYKGDSGGSLVCAGVVHGIASYGRAEEKLPGVFTRISKYVRWVNEVVRAYS